MLNEIRIFYLYRKTIAMKIGVAADHGGYQLKNTISRFLQEKGYEVHDFGATEFNSGDDYPDFVIPLAQAVAARKVERGIAVCGSGVGAAIAANKVKGARACLINDCFSAHQGVEDDDMNILCLGERVTGEQTALEYVQAFLEAEFSGLERHKRRLHKVIKIEEDL